MDELGFEQHKGALTQLAVFLHRITATILLISFAGYGLAGWMLFQDRVVEAVVIASLAYFFFRLFRTLSLFVVRRIAVLKGDLYPAMQWLDTQIEAHGAQAVIAEIDRRLFPKD